MRNIFKRIVKPQTPLALFYPFVSHLKMGLKRDAFRLDSFLHLNKHLKTFKEREKSMQPFCIVGHIKKYAKVQRVIEDWENAGELYIGGKLSLNTLKESLSYNPEALDPLPSELLV